MQASPVSPVSGSGQTASGSPQNATDAFGLSFDSLLKIVLTQLTYQDPLKPMDNFEFVSQLAQFSQIQQTQSMSDSLKTLVAAQSTSQAASLLGRQVDVPAGSGVLSGKVTAVAFANGSATLTLQLPNGQTISNIALSSISQIREAN